MAVIDAPAPFRTAVRGYDRDAVDAMMRAERTALQRLNERIAALEHHIAAARGAAFRVDDPNRKQSIQAAADLLSNAWDHARQLIAAEDATADLQRNHAAAAAAKHLDDVAAWAEGKERRARAEVDAMLAAAQEDADRMRAHAAEFVANHLPMAEQLLVDAAARSQERATAAENEVHHRVEAIQADLTQRQTTADYALQTAQRLHTQLAAESKARVEEALRMRDTGLARARALAEDLNHAVANQIAALEDDADRGLAELADHMAALSTELNSARQTIAARPTRAPRPKPEPQVAPTAARQAAPSAARRAAPAPAAETAPARVPDTADAEVTAPMPKAKVAPHKPAQAAPTAPRTRKTPPAAASAPKAATAKRARPAAKPAPEEANEVAAREPAAPTTHRSVVISTNGASIVRL